METIRSSTTWKYSRNAITTKNCVDVERCGRPWSPAVRRTTSMLLPAPRAPHSVVTWCASVSRSLRRFCTKPVGTYGVIRPQQTDERGTYDRLEDPNGKQSHGNNIAICFGAGVGEPDRPTDLRSHSNLAGSDSAPCDRRPPPTVPGTGVRDRQPSTPQQRQE
jgi:hypothetical protein